MPHAKFQLFRPISLDDQRINLDGRDHDASRRLWPRSGDGNGKGFLSLDQAAQVRGDSAFLVRRGVSPGQHPHGQSRRGCGRYRGQLIRFRVIIVQRADIQERNHQHSDQAHQRANFEDQERLVAQSPETGTGRAFLFLVAAPASDGLHFERTRGQGVRIRRGAGSTGI